MKSIILLLDGTWNDAEFGATDTNIVRLRDALGMTLRESSRSHVLYYERGVGTGPFDKIRGGAFGQGLEANVRRAYRFLASKYDPGDEVFIFGFSRGAYTARSLVGFIGAAGLLTPKNCTHKMDSLAWHFYRTRPGDRFSAEGLELAKHTYGESQFKVSCLAVFDTVGALGVPFRYFSRANREIYEFHDVYLSGIADLNLHAVAIDEHRVPFAATLWRRPAVAHIQNEAEQAWFPGSHADVGGGYTNRLGERNTKALDDLSLDWMLRGISRRFPRFPITEWIGDAADKAAYYTAPQHESRRGIYRVYPIAVRSVANRSIQVTGRQRLVSYERHDDPIGESVHISALERLGRRVQSSGMLTSYRPANLIAALPMLRASYDGGGVRHLTITDWNAEVIADDAAGKEKATAIISAAEERLGKDQH